MQQVRRNSIVTVKRIMILVKKTFKVFMIMTAFRIVVITITTADRNYSMCHCLGSLSLFLADQQVTVSYQQAYSDY